METIAFARGVPAPEMIPVCDLQSASRRAFESSYVDKMLSYGTGGGWPPLRERIANYHGVSTDEIVITSGSLQGFALLCEVIAHEAKAEGRSARIIVENPTYDRPLLILERLGIEAVPVRIDPATGVLVDELDAAMAKGVDLAYLIPTFQNPSGATVPAEHRQRIIELAQRYRVPVLEDDPYGSLYFDTPPSKTIHSMRSDAPICFSGSFSKTVAPGLRVGWLVLPKKWAQSVSTLANDTYISASFAAQATIDEYLDAGCFTPNVDRSRALLSERCQTLTDSIKYHLPHAKMSVPSGGYFLWLALPDKIDAKQVTAISAEHGVSFVPGASFGAGWESSIRLAFSSPPLSQLDEGVRRLANSVNAVMANAY